MAAATGPLGGRAIQQPPGPRSNFMVWFVTKGYRATEKLILPSNVPFADFLDRLRRLSAQVAQYYMRGRTTGFTLEDGMWHFTLQSNQPGKVAGQSPLNENLWYQTMISQLITPAYGWTHAVITHVSVGVNIIRIASLTSIPQDVQLRAEALGTLLEPQTSSETEVAPAAESALQILVGVQL